MKIEIEIPDAKVADCIGDAGVAIGFWCATFTRRGTLSFTLTCHDEEGKRYAASAPDVYRAVALMATEYPHHFRDLMADSGDAWTGHVLVQLAVFGDVRYD